MNITWLFGNGLDLSYGLKTSYSDFYDYLLQQEKSKEISDENLIFSQLKKDFSEHKEDLWADYEIRLGSITTNFSDEEFEKFVQDKIELDILLIEYLKNEASKLDINKVNNSTILKQSFSQITNGKKRDDNEKVISLLKDHSSENFYFKAISFNYTPTVSLLWDDKKASINNLKISGQPGHGHFVHLESPFYIHGTLDDGEAVIGLNDSSQIKNEIFKENSEILDTLIKTKLLDLAGQLKFLKFKEIISQSDLICVYGLSIGATDSNYWEIIKKRLLTNKAILIIYFYDKDFKYNHIKKTNFYIKKVKQFFYNNSNATQEEINLIEEKINVEFNNSLFILNNDLK